MGSLTWNGGPGLWSAADDWTVISGRDSVPGLGDDVLIAAATNYVVTVAGGQSARDVTLNSAGAQLDIVGTLAVGGTVAVAPGTIVLPVGGVLDGGTVTSSSDVSFSGGTLDGVTWLGSFSPGNAGSIDVENGLTLLNADGTAPGTLVLSSQLPVMTFVGGVTLDNAVLETNSDSDTTLDVAAGGTLTFGRGLQIDTTFDRGGLFLLGPGAYVNAGTILETGLQANVIAPFITVSGAFDNEGSISLSGAGEMTFERNLTNNGTIANAGGGLILEGGLLGDGTISALAPVSVAGTIEPGMVFVDNGSRFRLTASQVMPGITIENIGSGSSIDLTGLIDDGNINPVWSGTPKGGTLTINDGTVASTSLFLTGIQNGATFSVESDAGGGTVISTDNVPCFAAGTRVRTERGDRLVEGLEVGDIVLTGKDRRKATIVWLGYRHVSARRHPHPENVWPVRIAAEALADGVPARDVWLSPEHAVFLHGVLVPARHLINGATIRQIAVPEITYWHVELAEHALLTTEGMLSESYLDVGNRGDFEGLGVVALHPDFMAPLAALWAAKACAPQCRGGRMLEGIRQNLMRRAVRLGYSDVARNEEVVGLRA